MRRTKGKRSWLPQKNAIPTSASGSSRSSSSSPRSITPAAPPWAFAGKPLAAEFHLDPAQLGWLLSSFAIAYALGQIPGGALLDRYGSRRVYLWSITLWAIFTGMQAFVSWVAFVPVLISLFTLRLALGVAECPSFPANARIVANWFPKSERGTASAIFNASQYFSVVAFTPVMGWLAQDYGWRSVFLASWASSAWSARSFLRWWCIRRPPTSASASANMPISRKAARW